MRGARIFEKKNIARRRRGFTLTEVLIVVAIIAILLGIAVPSLYNAQKALEMNRLDETARQIFVAAQSRLTVMKSAGTLQTLSTRLTPTAMTKEPSDFGDTGLTWTDDTYYFVTNANSTTLLPYGSIDETVRSGSFVIEFNAVTGQVYGVFYWDGEATFSYGTDTVSRDIADRKKIPVGYYGGSGAIEPTGVSETPFFEVKNDIALTATLTLKANVEYEIIITDASSDKSVTYEFSLDGIQYETSLAGDIIYDYLNSTVIITLDSLVKGLQFKDLYCGGNSPGFTVGCNLIIEATAFTGGVISDTVKVEVNSLYGARNDELLDDTGALPDVTTVTVANARHLQNLDTSFSGISYALNIGAVQTADIVVPEMVAIGQKSEAFTFTSIYNSGLKSYDGSGLYISGLTIAEALSDAHRVGLFGEMSGEMLGTSGRKTITGVNIVNPKITNTLSDCTGALVGLANAVDITDCHVYVDADSGWEEFAITGKSFVGGMVGYAVNCTFTECSASTGSVISSGRVVPADNSPIVSIAGGFVGGSYNCTISECYSNTGYVKLTGSGSSVTEEVMGKIEALDIVGTFIGENSGETVTNCYSLGMATGTQASTVMGGFVGSSVGAKYTNCYTAARYTDTDTSNKSLGKYYAFCRDNSSSPSTYSYCYYLSAGESQIAVGIKSVTISELVNITMDSADADWTTATEKTTFRYAFKTNTNQKIYPYPALASQTHFGDWVTQDVFTEGSGLGYYELYSDGSYGYALYDNNGKLLMSSLKDTGAVKEDGYAFICPEDVYSAGTMAVSYYTGGSADVSTVSLNKAAAAIEGESYNVYRIEPSSAILTTAYNSTNTYYSIGSGKFFFAKLTVSDLGDFYFNKYFPNTAQNGLDSEPTSIPGALVIRTARHLANLGGYDNTAFLKYAYVQTRNVGFTTYNFDAFSWGQNTLSPIGYGNGEPFTGSFDGGSYSITAEAISVTSAAAHGLFGYVSAGSVIKNVNLIITGTYAVNASEGSGGFVGVNYGSISGCTVKMLSLTNGNNGATGGFVGVNNGTIEGCTIPSMPVSGQSAVGGFAGSITGGSVKNCFAVNSAALSTPIAISASGGGSSSGGFVGVMSGGVVENCAAVGFKVTGYSNVGGFVGLLSGGTITKCSGDTFHRNNADFGVAGLSTSSGNVGGFVGSNSGSISDCYSLAYVSGGSIRYGFAGSGGSTVVRSYCVAVNPLTGAYLNFSNATVATCYSFSSTANTASNIVTYDTMATTLAATLGTAWGAAEQENTYPTSAFSGYGYPFPAIVRLNSGTGAYVHYGDWPYRPTVSSENIQLAYFEIYKATSGYTFSVGFYNPDIGFDTLKYGAALNGYTIVQDGYCVMLRGADQGNSGQVLTYNGTMKASDVTVKARVNGIEYTCHQGSYDNNSTVITSSVFRYQNASGAATGYNVLSIDGTSSKTIIASDGTRWVPFFLPEGAYTTASDDFYQQIYITSEQTRYEATYYFNPHVAKSPFRTTSAISRIGTLYVRTERQYSSLSNMYDSDYFITGNGNGFTFVQERNLVFGANNLYTKFYFTTTVFAEIYRNVYSDTLANSGRYSMGSYTITVG